MEQDAFVKVLYDELLQILTEFELNDYTITKITCFDVEGSEIQDLKVTFRKLHRVKTDEKEKS
jgi:hypothetical protein